MKYVHHALPTDVNSVNLYSISDIHIGNPEHDSRAWNTVLDNIAGDPNALVVLNGDLTEMALKSSKYGDTYHTLSPKEERKRVTKDLTRIRDKIALITSGNHDMRPEKDSDENPVGLIADTLGLEDRYDPISAVLDVSFGKWNGDATKRTSFQFFVTHGAGGGRRPGGKINRMQELSMVMDSVDGYLMGHVHSFTSYIEYRFSPNPYAKKIGRRPVAYVIGGSFLNYGGYSEIGMFTPNAVSMPILRLHEKKSSHPFKQMEIIMPTYIWAKE